MKGNTLGKEERLKRRKIIKTLFEKGFSFPVYPFRIVWQETSLPSNVPVQLAISVPSGNFSKAVDRNRIKRLIREAYRLNKHGLYRFLIERKAQCALMIIYTGKKMPDYPEISGKIILILERFQKEYEIHQKNA